MIVTSPQENPRMFSSNQYGGTMVVEKEGSVDNSWNPHQYISSAQTPVITSVSRLSIYNCGWLHQSKDFFFLNLESGSTHPGRNADITLTAGALEGCNHGLEIERFPTKRKGPPSS